MLNLPTERAGKRAGCLSGGVGFSGAEPPQGRRPSRPNRVPPWTLRVADWAAEGLPNPASLFAQMLNLPTERAGRRTGCLSGGA
eukprot:3170997-Alexandrium_andersonii.AAC.1